MTHRNARLIPVTRAELVEQVRDGWPQAESGPPVLRLPCYHLQVGAAVPRRWGRRAP